MMYKAIALLFLLAQSTLVLADTCPSVTDIKHQKAAGWKAYDSDDSTRLSEKRAAKLRHAIEQFTLAEWSGDQNKSSIHCYYRDKNGSELEAYFSKNNFLPKDTHHYWYQVSGSMQCAAGANYCEFQQNVLENPKLAKK